MIGRIQLYFSCLLGVMASVVVFATLYQPFASRPSGENRVLMPPMGINNIHVRSCGVAAYAFAIDRLKLYAPTITAEALQREADINMGFLSLDDISTALGESGAKATSLYIQDIRTFCHLLDQNSVAIFHVDSEYRGHFVAIRRLSAGNFELLDRQDQIEKMEEGDLIRIIGVRASGYVLRVYRGERRPDLAIDMSSLFTHANGQEPQRLNFDWNEPTVNESVQTHNFGNLFVSDTITRRCNPDTKQLSVPILLRNNGKEAMEIVAAKGSCQCFLGLDKKLPLVLKGNQEVTLKAAFGFDSKLVRERSVAVAFRTNCASISFFPVVINLVSTVPFAPFIVSPDRSLGIQDWGTAPENEFLLLQEVLEGQFAKIVKCEVLEGNGIVDIQVPYAAYIWNEPFEVSTIKVCVSPLKVGNNTFRARLTLDNGETPEITIRAFGQMM